MGDDVDIGAGVDADAEDVDGCILNQGRSLTSTEYIRDGPEQQG